jgi:hypothetical protein
VIITAFSLLALMVVCTLIAIFNGDRATRNLAAAADVMLLCFLLLIVLTA